MGGGSIILNQQKLTFMTDVMQKALKKLKYTFKFNRIFPLLNSQLWIDYALKMKL